MKIALWVLKFKDSATQFADRPLYAWAEAVAAAILLIALFVTIYLATGGLQK